MLSRSLASEGWYPPIQVLDSISRLMPAVTTPEHRARASHVRRLLAAWARSEDLVRIGAYKAGSDPELDQAMRARGVIRQYLMQDATEQMTMDESVQMLMKMEL